MVNASDLNEMPANSLYVEGSQLDRFLKGEIYLQRVRATRSWWPSTRPTTRASTRCRPARATLGLDAEIVELQTPLQLIAQMKNGMATGEVLNWRELVDQVKDLEFDAGLATPITIDSRILPHDFQHGGVNPVGGVEAVASKLIADALDKPVAHGPVDYALEGFTEVVDPRMAVDVT